MEQKNIRVNAANETLQAFKNGFYMYGDEQTDLTKSHEKSLENTILYEPSDLDNIDLSDCKKFDNTNYSLLDMPVVSTIRELYLAEFKNIGVLNFASAKNAGGGFLNGALAQEESLATSSDLYLTQITKNKYYDSNRKCNTMLYTDYMIYSKYVNFIRDDIDSFWISPIVVSVLTAPAVNMGQYIRRENHDVKLAEETMKNRMRKVLKVFAAQSNTTLILGAYGCGVFRNDPKIVARFFKELLQDEGFGAYFQDVFFAIFDRSKTKNVFKSFESEIESLIN